MDSIFGSSFESLSKIRWSDKYECLLRGLKDCRVVWLHLCGPGSSEGQSSTYWKGSIAGHTYIYIYLCTYIFLYVHNYQYSNIVIHLVCESRFIHAALAFAAMHDLVLQALGQDGRSSRATLWTTGTKSATGQNSRRFSCSMGLQREMLGLLCRGGGF